MSSIYVFEGNGQKIVGEKFKSAYTGNIQVYVWKSADGTLGFDSQDAVPFVQLLTAEASTLQFPDFDLLVPSDETREIFRKLNSVTFFNAENSLVEEHDRLVNYEKQKNKNLLLQRFNKPVQKLELPEIFTWYDQDEKRYTEELMNFAASQKLKFIVWGFSEFGNYFWSMSDIFEIVKMPAVKEGILIEKVNKMSEMPYH